MDGFHGESDMISLQDIAREYGMSDDEVATILRLSKQIREIGLDNYTVNAIMAGYFRKKLAKHKKKNCRTTDSRK